MPACSTSLRNRFTASLIDSFSRSRSLTTKTSWKSQYFRRGEVPPGYSSTDCDREPIGGFPHPAQAGVPQDSRRQLNFKRTLILAGYGGPTASTRRRTHSITSIGETGRTPGARETGSAAVSACGAWRREDPAGGSSPAWGFPGCSGCLFRPQQPGIRLMIVDSGGVS